MSDAPTVMMASLAGCGLGALFFGGLWWTVRLSVGTAQPGLWFFASVAIRTTVTLGGFYLLALIGWQALFAALTGFLVTRVLFTRFGPAPISRAARRIGDGAS